MITYIRSRIGLIADVAAGNTKATKAQETAAVLLLCFTGVLLGCAGMLAIASVCVWLAQVSPFLLLMVPIIGGVAVYKFATSGLKGGNDPA